MKQSGFFQLVLILSFILFTSARANAQQTPQKFLRETDYLLSLPDGYNADTSKKWPLVMFLHGSGERGNDIGKVEVNGPPKLVAAGKKFPFILVSPQAKEDEDGWEPENLYHLLVYLKKTYRADPDRIYLTGLSMGGFGTWKLATNHPEEFAAIVPICGGGDTSMAWRLRYTPVWCFHGALDNVVPVSKDEQMVASVRKYNPSVKFTVYPDLYHNSWERTYNNDSLYTWLLAQKKFRYREIKLNPKALTGYEGTYVGPERDTIRLSADSAGLHATAHHQTFLLKAADGDVFYVFDNALVDLKFIRNKKGVYDSFIVFEDSKNLYTRIP
jgi:predicted esterase